MDLVSGLTFIALVGIECNMVIRGEEMDMPTVCDCGEIVEYADMITIGELLVCEDCYNDHI